MARSERNINIAGNSNGDQATKVYAPRQEFLIITLHLIINISEIV